MAPSGQCASCGGGCSLTTAAASARVDHCPLSCFLADPQGSERYRREHGRRRDRRFLRGRERRQLVASARRRAVPTGENAATWWHGHSCRASGCSFHRAPAASIELITQLRRDILRYQPIQMVGGEATTMVGQRRAELPLLLQAHRLTLASPAAGPVLKHAGERRPAIHATPVLVKTPAG